MAAALNLAKSVAELKVKAVDLTKIHVDENASELDKEKFFDLQKSIDLAVSKGDKEAINRIQKEWAKTSS